MAGTREAQLAEMTPVSRKQAAAPILARRARCSEICPALTMQHSKPFRLLQQGAFWAGRHRAKRRLARLRKELCAPVAPFTRVRGRGQPVKKVGIELVATTNRARNAPKPACLMPYLGPKRTQREFFNSAPWPLRGHPEAMKMELPPRLFSHQAGVFCELCSSVREVATPSRLTRSATGKRPNEPTM
jgi:hypothetical protein